MLHTKTCNVALLSWMAGGATPTVRGFRAIVPSLCQRKARATTATTTTTTTRRAVSNDTNRANGEDPVVSMMSMTPMTPINRLQHYTRLKNSYFALRHGQSEANVANLIASTLETAGNQYGLSPVGHAQAQRAGKDVVETYQAAAASSSSPSSSWQGVCVLTSDLLRARETAEWVRRAVQEAGIPLYPHPHNRHNHNPNQNNHTQEAIVEPRLRERNFGTWDLTTDANYPLVWQDDAINASHTIQGVESVHSVLQRATQIIVDYETATTTDTTTATTATAFASLEEEEEEKKYMVICVAHGDVLQILQTAFCKYDGTRHRSMEHLETATLRRLELAV